MFSGRLARGGALRYLAVALVVAVALAACTPEAPAAVAVDGGSRGVALLGDVLVDNEPGTTLTLTHAGAPAGDHEAPTTHIFVGGAAADALPPLFVGGQGGLAPNPGVWGPCTGGDASAARGACPVPPVEGPTAWDGRSYWSTGAMLPGESREIPLAEDLAKDAALVCALHPELRVVVGSTEQPSPTEAPSARVEAALQVQTEVDDAAMVSAGLNVEDAYVAAFVPATIRIAAGETVTWRAGGRAPVDVVFNEQELDLTHTDPRDGLPGGDARAWNGRGTLRSGYLSTDPTTGAAATQWTVRFTRPGRYRYASRFGPEFEGTVVVR